MLNMSTDGNVDEQNVFRRTIAVIECFVISFTETLRLHPILIWHFNM